MPPLFKALNYIPTSCSHANFLFLVTFLNLAHIYGDVSFMSETASALEALQHIYISVSQLIQISTHGCNFHIPIHKTKYNYQYNF